MRSRISRRVAQLLGVSALLIGAELSTPAALAQAPTVSLSAYLGGNGDEVARAVAVDGEGNIYVTGETFSLTMNETEPGLGDAGGLDAFVMKLAPDGSLVYLTYLGGSGIDVAKGIAVDAAGAAYVVGETGSADFPTANAAQATYGGGETDIFLSVLDPSGEALVFSTFLGGADCDRGNAVALGSDGTIAIAGYSRSTDFPTAAPFQDEPSSPEDAVVALFAADGALTASTFLGGDGDDIARGVAVGADGAVYVTGETASTDFPTANPLQAVFGGERDAFVAKIAAGGGELSYATYVGGSGLDIAKGIAVRTDGSASIVGETGSTDYPTSNAFQATYGGGETDVLVSTLSPDGATLTSSTFLGGTDCDRGNAIALDADGRLIVAGYSRSTDYPLQDAPQGEMQSPEDAVVSVVAGDALSFSSFLGGQGDDIARGVAVGPDGAVIVVGETVSTDFPTTAGANLPGRDGFVAVLRPA